MVPFQRKKLQACPQPNTLAHSQGQENAYKSTTEQEIPSTMLL